MEEQSTKAKFQFKNYKIIESYFELKGEFEQIINSFSVY
jgi:hypothetical protein